MSLVVFDIGGTTIKYALWNDNEMLSKKSIDTPKTWDDMLSNLTMITDDFKKQHKIEGVCISSPGAVDTKSGIIKGLSSIPYIHNFPIKKAFSDSFDLPVTIENDANCAALAEINHGMAQGYDSAILLVIGTGVGGAFIVKNEIIKGPNLFGGEFGCMLLDEENTLSTLSSPVTMANNYNRDLNSNLTGKEIFDLAEQYDPSAILYVDNLINPLARCIYNLLVYFNPEIVIIGGAISQRNKFITALKTKTMNYLIKNNAEFVTINIKPCKYFNDANLIGAVVNYEKMIKIKS